MTSEIHSKPIESSEYPALVEALKDEPRVVSQLPASIEEDSIEPAPSIYHIINKQTFLSKELEQEDTNESRIINEFIIKKIKAEGFNDDKEGYHQVLKNILANSGLTMKHNSATIIDYIYSKFLNKDMSAKDYLLFLDILTGREIKSGKFNR